MASNTADLLVVLSLFVILSVSFISSLPIIYENKFFFEDEALIRALNDLNNAIQIVYGHPLSSITLKIYLPMGSWIIIENSTIKYSKNIKIQLFDQNKIISSIGDNYIVYKLTFYNKTIISNNINNLVITFLGYNIIIIKQTG
ncbi:MAG: hypothetical protein RQ952_06760 [Thermoproteota archaeon]|jgi:hypothetical protein|nr:hypothetical protein [Thermoproteota archaeon]